MHDTNNRKLIKLLNEACLLLKNGRIKNSYRIADNRRKLSAFIICRIHIPYILHIVRKIRPLGELMRKDKFVQISGGKNNNN